MTDWCRVCNVHGAQPCVDEHGNDTTDHPGRPVAGINESTWADHRKADPR